MKTSYFRKTSLLLIIILLFFSQIKLIGQIPYPGENPGIARVDTASANKVILENNALRMEFTFDGKNIRITDFEDMMGEYGLQAGPFPLFELTLRDGSRITSDDFSLTGQPLIKYRTGDISSTTFSNKLTGTIYSASLENKNNGLSLIWEAELKNGQNYIRQRFKFNADDPEEVMKVTLVKIPGLDAVKMGSVDGSPIVYKNMFFTLEYPLSQVEKHDNSITASLSRLHDELTTVWGVTPSDQLRRGFLYYVG